MCKHGKDSLLWGFKKFNGQSDEFHVKTAETIEEACKLAQVGFDYFTTIDSVQLFRKRK